MEELNEIKIEPNLRCGVCGEQEFNLRDGYYYCQECGTKQEQMRVIEVVQDDEFDETKHYTKQKIKIPKAKKPELTSWECYNYILRGFVEELLSMGAKEDFKVLTLQLWSAYLRRMEVAFFSKKYAELPKLGIRYLDRDARTLYNHGLDLRRKRKKRRSDDTSLISGQSNSRKLRKSLQNLDKSTYSLQSQSQSETSGGFTSLSQTSGGSTSTGTTTHAIQLRFNAKARKYLKRIMPRKHLSKHELDSSKQMACHRKKPKVRTMNQRDHALYTMNIKQLYGILALALNLVQDDIQLSDLVRFNNEGHLSGNKALEYFPENISPHGKQLLREINFHIYPDKYTDKVLREHVGLLAKYIHVSKFTKPDISKLVLRYVTDLNLPEEVAVFADRLINLLPPQMQTRAPYTYPPYEARAMAYVVFVLKLFFGLDGHKERHISTAAQQMNTRIDKYRKESSSPSHASLFVWSEWVEFVERRKVIVSKYNSNFARQFKQPQSFEQWMNDELAEDQRANEKEVNEEKGKSMKILNTQRIFSNLLESLTNSNEDATEVNVFQPSLTPALTYFKRILLKQKGNSSKTPINTIQIETNHAERTLLPYLDAGSLRSFLEARQCKLRVVPLACTARHVYVGVFRSPIDKGSKSSELPVFKPDFDITEEEWLQGIKTEAIWDDLEFNTKMVSYSEPYMKKVRSKQKRELSETKKPIRNIQGSVDNTDVLSLYSNRVFSEDNMDPIEGFSLNEPRRQLDSIDLFSNISDNFDNIADETVTDSQDEISENLNNSSKSSNVDTPLKYLKAEKVQMHVKELTLLISNMDCWLLLGSMTALYETQKKVLESKFPRSFLWLLETCAYTIGVEPGVVYEQLLAIELMFVHGIEKLDNFQDCVHFNYTHSIKDINVLINLYREIW